VLSLLLSFSASQLNAQCDRVAWVAGEQQGCGVKLIDLNTGELMLAIDGASALNFGQTITFSADYVDIPPACSLLGLPAISLTCISTNLPCEADFDYVVDDLNPYQFSFGASVFDPSVQDCNWDFGDGTEMTGVYTQHTFASEGYYDVCLTIMDNTGCEAQICKEIFVSELNPGWCGYDMQLTAVGTNLQGKVFATSSDVGTLQNVQWFNSKTNQVIGQNAQLDYALPSYGNYLICAQYQVETPDGNLCSNTICRQLTVAEPGCASPLLYNYNAICPPVYAPVCGCDGVAYGNECEAMAAGVTGWWEGECSSIGYGNCSADLSMEVISGGPGGFEVEFTNLASGDYNYTQLDFGDGTPLYEATNWDKVTHIYQQGGIYRTNLTVWKNSSCVQSVTRLLVTDAVNMNADMMPVGTDYVLPGDANGDGRANMYDLLNVGVGYNELGSPRPNASVTWSPQFAPNWPSATGPGVNMKHVDCDGNGIVNEFDPSVIQQNYSPLDTNEVVWNPLAPEVWLEFEEDTLYLDPNNPQTLEISADLMVGTPSAPVFGLYGMALAMKYPEYVNHDPGTDYDDDSFFGFSNYLLWLPRDNYSRRQLDMGFSQKQGNGKSGYGRIANITFRADFIIIIDIVDRASTDAVPFTVPIKGLKGVDAQGNKKDLNVAAVQDTVWIKMVETTSTQAPQSVQDAVQVYPNPASGAVQVYTGKLQVEKMQLIDPLGRVLQSKEANPNNAVQQLLLDDIAPGLYQLRLQTNQGLVEKKLMVH
jgi:PKD repeat protein